MTPSAIVRAAKEAGLDLIGICDHNSAENVPALTKAAEGTGLDVLGGLEVSSREEVHVLGLFDRDARRPSGLASLAEGARSVRERCGFEDRGPIEGWTGC